MDGMFDIAWSQLELVLCQNDTVHAYLIKGPTLCWIHSCSTTGSVLMRARRLCSPVTLRVYALAVLWMEVQMVVVMVMIVVSSVHPLMVWFG